MNDAIAPPTSRRPLRGGLAALAVALAGALGMAMDPAQAIVDVSAVTLVGEGDGPAPAASASARSATPQAASDALLSTSALHDRMMAGAMPERGNPATAQRRHIAVGRLVSRQMSSADCDPPCSSTTTGSRRTLRPPGAACTR